MFVAWAGTGYPSWRSEPVLPCRRSATLREGRAAARGPTHAGYRFYGEEAERCQVFVAWAKRLGLSLEGIAELLEYENEGRHRKTRDHLQCLSLAKLKELHVEYEGLARRGRSGQRSSAPGRVRGSPMTNDSARRREGSRRPTAACSKEHPLLPLPAVHRRPPACGRKNSKEYS